MALCDLGIDIGGTFIKYLEIDCNNTIVDSWRKPTLLFDNPSSFYDYVCKGLPDKEFGAVGVSCPGVLAEDSTVCSHAARAVQPMFATNVNQEVSKRFERPCFAMNDGKAAGYCEFRLGAGCGTRSSAYVILGTGIGGCLCDRQGVIQGVDGIAGEFSNLPMGFEAGGGLRARKFAHAASTNALLELYRQYGRPTHASEDDASRIAAGQGALEPLTGEVISERYMANEPAAVRAVDDWCRNIALGLYAIELIYNPEVICLGGGISEAPWLLSRVRDAFFHEVHVISEPVLSTRIERCRFGCHANALGAVLNARMQTHTKR